MIMLKYIPGVIGALAGFITLLFVRWLDNWSLEFAAFIAAYLFVTISLDKALVSYGNKMSG